MPSYEERSQQNKAEAEKIYYSASNTDNKSVQIGAKRGDTGRYAVIHSDGGVTSNGDKVFNASAPQDGFVRGNASGNAIALEHRNISQDDDIPAEEEETPTSNIIILFLKDNALYVGGDRAEPELVYELEEGFYYVGRQCINKNENGYIISFAVVNSLTQKLCVITDGTLTSSELPILYQYNFLSTSFSKRIDIASSSLAQVLYPNVSASGETGVYMNSDIPCVAGIQNPPAGTVGLSTNAYSFDDKALTSSVPSAYRTEITASFFPTSSSADTEIKVGDVVAWELIADGAIGWFQTATTTIEYNLSGQILVVSCLLQGSPRPVAFIPPVLPQSTHSGVARLRKRHPNIINQQGFFGGYGISSAGESIGEDFLSRPDYTIYSFGVDTINGISSFESNTLTSVNKIIEGKLFYNGSDFVGIKYGYAESVVFDLFPSTVSIFQANAKSYPIAISLDRSSSLVAIYNPRSCEDDIYLKRAGQNDIIFPFADLYIPLDDSVFPAGDGRKGEHLLNFFTPNLVDNTIYTVTNFANNIDGAEDIPLTESGETDVIITDIQQSDITFTVQSERYIGLTDEFRSFVIDASYYA